MGRGQLYPRARKVDPRPPARARPPVRIAEADVVQMHLAAIEVEPAVLQVGALQRASSSMSPFNARPPVDMRAVAPAR